MLLILATASMAVQLRQDAPPLTPGEARALTASALGDALLAPGHPIVVEKVVGPEGMVPLPPPGAPVLTQITLYMNVRPSARKGFCERIVATVNLKPAAQSELGAVLAATPDTLSTQLAYRWVGAAQARANCDAPRWTFFSPKPSEAEAGLSTVELLASAKEQSQTSRSLPFEVFVEDKEGPEMQAVEREHPEVAPSPELRTIVDAKQALAELPVDKVRYVSSSERVSDNLLTQSDLIEIRRRKLVGRILFLGNDWTATMLLDGERIVRIRLLRAFPPPP